MVESNRKLAPYQYPGTVTIYPAEQFGYNRFLNVGLEHTSSEFICLANNDLKFLSGWATAILDASSAHPDVLSFSPVDPWLHKKFGLSEMPDVVFGYEKMKHVTGWCFVVRRGIFKRIGRFDENLSFWYVDDDYIETLLEHGVRHALVKRSQVFHLSGETISSREVSTPERTRLTREQWLYFDYKWNHRSRALYALKRLIFRLRSGPRQGAA